MKFRNLSMSMSLIALLSNACNNRDSGSQSNLSSLTDNDVKKMFDTRENFDEKTEKVMVFIEAENDLTNGGESFFREYESLMKNNIGHNYSIYMLTSAPENSAWATQLKRDWEYPQTRKENIGQIKYLDFGVTQASINRLVKQVSIDINNRKKVLNEGEEQKKIQVFFHFLAHGISLRAKGDGFVGLSDQGILTWRELAEDIIEPIAQASDETIAVVESCFGSNFVPELKNNFFHKNNVMLIVGAPAWASQLAPTQETGGDDIGNSDFARRYFRSSVASLALKAALMGYASEGLISEAGDDANKELGEQEVTDEGGNKQLAFGGETLKEKFVVRADELTRYIQSKGKQINCDFMLHKHFEDLSQMCNDGEIPRLGMNIGTVGTSADLKVRIPGWMKLSKEEFVNSYNQYSPIPEVFVFNTKIPDATLNPHSAGNGIISIANMSLASATNGNDLFHKMALLPKEGYAGIDSAVSECKSHLNKITADMYDVLKVLSSEQTPKKESSTADSASDSKDSESSDSDSEAKKSDSDWEERRPALCNLYKQPFSFMFFGSEEK